MRRSTKISVIIILATCILGALGVGGVAGFLAGCKYEKRQTTTKLQMAKENFRRIRELRHGEIQERPFGEAKRHGGQALIGFQDNAIRGIVLEIEQEEETWLVIMPQNIDENVWKVQITENTKIMKGAAGAEIKEIQEGQNVICIGEKDTSTSTIKAELVNIVEGK